VPQLVGSVCVSEQRPLQNDWPLAHPHVPPLQSWLPGHALPHVPQLPGSFSGSTHPPLHATRPVAQTQPERWQVYPVGQTIPHPPQFCGSLRVLTHAPLHVVSPRPRELQLAVHRPRLHTSVAAHAFPHAPQLS
jgi:hypothetical protein